MKHLPPAAFSFDLLHIEHSISCTDVAKYSSLKDFLRPSHSFISPSFWLSTFLDWNFKMSPQKLPPNLLS